MKISSIIDQNSSQKIPIGVKLLILFIILGILVIFIFSDDDIGIAREKLWLEQAMRGELVATISGTGNIVPTNERLLLAKQGGIVIELLKEPGEIVNINDPLLVLSNPKLSNSLSQAKFNLQQLRIERSEIVLGNKSEESRAIEDINVANDRMILAEIEEKANKKLVESKVISELDYHRKMIAFEQAKRQLASMKLRLSEQLVPLWEARLGIIDAKINNAELNYKQIEIAVSELVVRSNVNGTIVNFDNNIKLGAHISVGNKIGHITDLTNMRVEFKIAAQRSRDIVVGMPVTLNYFAGSFNGLISTILPGTEQEQIKLYVELEKPYPAEIKLGLSVTGNIEVGRYEDVLYIPRPVNAIEESNAELYVLRNDSSLKLTNISFGKGSERFLIVNAGLLEGDKVVLSDLSEYKQAKIIEIIN